MSSRKPLLIIGAGTIATNYAESFAGHPEFKICGFIEDDDDLSNSRMLEGLPVYSTSNALEMADSHRVICAIGSPNRRQLVERFEAAGFQFATLLSPQSLIHPKATIEPGCVISDQTDIDPYIHIGRHSIVSAKVSFGHHSSMGAFGFIGPGTIIAGNCTIGTNCYIGMAAVIKDHITIGDGATIGAGAVVVKDVEPGTTVVGNPARPLKSKNPTSTETASAKKPLLLLGAGDMAEVFAPAFNNYSEYEVVGYVVDDDASYVGDSLMSLPRLSVKEALKLADTHTAVSIIGSPDKEGLIARFEAAGFKFAKFLSPLSDFSPDCEIETGVIVSSYSLIDPFTRIGRHSIISVKVLVSHHSKIGPFSFVGPGTTIAGNTTIGSHCFIGAGAILRDGISVGDRVVIGAGAVVIKDVPSGTTVVGNPAKPISPPVAAPPSRKPLLFLGSGTMATNYARLFGDHPEFQVTAFVRAPGHDQEGDSLHDLPVISVEEAMKLRETHAVIGCIGSAQRITLIEQFETAGFPFISMIAPSARVEESASVGPGCFVNHDSSIAGYAKVGAHSFVMRRVIFGHHASMGPYGTIAAGVIIGGSAQIGSGCFIGMGAIIRDHITLGDNVTVGAGSVVVQDVPDGETVAGNPAKSLPRMDRQRKPLLILGAGNMASTYASEFRDDPEFEIIGFVQDTVEKTGEPLLEGLPIMGVEEALPLRKTHAALCAIGSSKRQPFIQKFEKAGFEFATLISPSAIVHGRDGIEPGCVISDLANIDPHIRLGRHTLVTSRVTVAHHASVGPCSFLAPGTTIGGHCKIGARCFIGMGAIIRDHINIGDDVTVGAGAVVVSDVPSGATVVGIPAKPLMKSSHKKAS